MPEIKQFIDFFDLLFRYTNVYQLLYTVSNFNEIGFRNPLLVHSGSIGNLED